MASVLVSWDTDRGEDGSYLGHEPWFEIGLTPGVQEEGARAATPGCDVGEDR